jgi:hypothetical protein
MYNLIELIKASGFSGTPGQSFQNNVSGATTGVAMTDYKFYDISFSGQPNAQTIYPSGQQFTVQGVATGGSRFSNIAQSGPAAFTLTALLVTENQDGTFLNLGNAQVNRTGFSASGSEGMVYYTLQFNVTGETPSSFSFSIDPMLSTPEGEEGVRQLIVNVGVNSGQSGSPNLVEIVATYDPDIAEFNPGVTLASAYPGFGEWDPTFQPGWRGLFQKRVLTGDDFCFAWYAYHPSYGYVKISDDQNLQVVEDLGFPDRGWVYPTNYGSVGATFGYGLLRGESTYPLQLRYWRKTSPDIVCALQNSSNWTPIEIGSVEDDRSGGPIEN